jgi:predicted  nucleic acid-binding Zn-ribbon protein
MKNNELETLKLEICERDEKNSNLENLIKSGGKEHQLLFQKVRDFEKEYKTANEEIVKLERENRLMKKKVNDIEMENSSLKEKLEKDEKDLEEVNKSLELKAMMYKLLKIEMWQKYGHDETDTEDENEEVEPPRQHSCHLCAFVGKCESGLKTHITVKHKVRCVKCNEKFANNKELEKHVC